MLVLAKRCGLPAALTQIHTPQLGTLGARSIHPNGPINQFPVPTRKFDILFWGRDEFSCIALQRLYEANHLWNTLAVVTTPDTRVTRRGSKIVESPLKFLAEKLGLRYYLTPKNPNDTKKMTFDPPLHPRPHHPCPFSDQALLVVASFGQFIPKKILKCFWPGRKLNIHPSLLPKYRGAAPIQWAIADGLDETGVSIMEVERVGMGYDVGDIWDQRSLPIPPGATYDSLAPVLAREGSQLLLEVMERIVAGTQPPSTEQIVEKATGAPACGSETVSIDWETWDAEKVERMGRAFQRNRPLMSHAFDGADRVQLFDVTVLPPADYNPLLDSKKPGLAHFSKNRETLDVQCASGTQISIGSVRQRNKKRIPAKEWWNGVWPSRKEDGFVRLNRVKEESSVEG